MHCLVVILTHKGLCKTKQEQKGEKENPQKNTRGNRDRRRSRKKMNHQRGISDGDFQCLISVEETLHRERS